MSPSRAPLRIIVSRALRAAIRARLANKHLSIIAFADFGCSAMKSPSVSATDLSTIHRTSEFQSLSFVCHSNCGSGTFTEMIAVRPSATSSFVRLVSFSVRKFFSRAYLLIVLVSAVRNPVI